ncbi:Serine incorporator 2, partial [Ananas comosus]
SKKPLLKAGDTESGKEESKEGEPRPVSYSYTFFHLIFALASMYSAMLLTGWTSSTSGSELIDVGWTTVWVRICTEWATGALYIWTLIAPLVLPDLVNAVRLITNLLTVTEGSHRLTFQSQSGEGAPSAPKPGTICGPPCGPDLQVVLVARHSGVLDDNPLHVGIGWPCHPKRRL